MELFILLAIRSQRLATNESYQEHQSSRRQRESTAISQNVRAPLLIHIVLSILALSLMKLSNNAVLAERMVRLCIASVDPVKLSSQCVMCNRREFPLTVIDCTGITKVNDLIANPLTVQEATCLIYNCRRQVPDVKPEPYHGSVSHAANYRGVVSSTTLNSLGSMGSAGSRLYEIMTPSGIFNGGYSTSALPAGPIAPVSPYTTRFGLGHGSYGQASDNSGTTYSQLGPLTPRGLIGGPSYQPDRIRGPLPYALVPASSTFPFG